MILASVPIAAAAFVLVVQTSWATMSPERGLILRANPSRCEEPLANPSSGTDDLKRYGKQVLWPDEINPLAMDLYARLGATREMDSKTIQKKFRRAALLVHPDKHPTDDPSIKAAYENAFKRVSEAYEVLNDPIKRDRYDKTGSTSSSQSSGTSRPQWENVITPEMLASILNILRTPSTGNPYADKLSLSMKGGVMRNMVIYGLVSAKPIRDEFLNIAHGYGVYYDAEPLREMALYLMGFVPTYPEFAAALMQYAQSLGSLSSEATAALARSFETRTDFAYYVNAALRSGPWGSSATQKKVLHTLAERLMAEPPQSPGFIAVRDLLITLHGEGYLRSDITQILADALPRDLTIKNWLLQRMRTSLSTEERMKTLTLLSNYVKDPDIHQLLLAEFPSLTAFTGPWLSILESLPELQTSDRIHSLYNYVRNNIYLDQRDQEVMRRAIPLLKRAARQHSSFLHDLAGYQEKRRPLESKAAILALGGALDDTTILDFLIWLAQSERDIDRRVNAITALASAPYPERAQKAIAEILKNGYAPPQVMAAAEAAAGSIIANGNAIDALKTRRH